MIKEEEILKMRPAAQTIAFRQLEVAKKVRAMMVDTMAMNNGDMSKCGGVYLVHDEVAATDRNYHTREGVRKAVAAVAPELLRYATAFPELVPRTAQDDATRRITQESAVAPRTAQCEGAPRTAQDMGAVAQEGCSNG